MAERSVWQGLAPSSVHTWNHLYRDRTGTMIVDVEDFGSSDNIVNSAMNRYFLPFYYIPFSCHGLDLFDNERPIF